MNRKLVWRYMILIVIAIILTIVQEKWAGNVVVNQRQRLPLEKWELDMEERDGDYYFSRVLPEEGIENQSLAFPTSHLEVEVTIDGEMVYTLCAGNPKWNKSTGYYWNFIQFDKEDAGKELVIHMMPCYTPPSVNKRFYYGCQRDVFQLVFAESGPRFVLSVLILIIGIILFIYMFFILDRTNMDEDMIHFSIFTILLACWSMMESPVMDLIGLWPVGDLILDHYSLMIMPLAFGLFLRKILLVKDVKAWEIYLGVIKAVIAIRTFLQVTTLCDLKQTLWMTQICILGLVVMTIIMAIRTMKIAKITSKMKLNFVCILFIMAATMYELILFQLYDKKSILAMVGFVFYTGIMSLEMIKKSRIMMERAQEAEVYRKLAYMDELTGTYNRTAFQQDLNNHMLESQDFGRAFVTPKTIFMFDLNDLKKCNDTYGHEKGDEYIKMVAQILIHVMGIDAKCYRIGGDEFCAIMQNSAQSEIDNKLISIIRETQELDRKGFVVPISVAVGYAVFNPEYDESLEDTMKRADMLMYQNKQLIKKHQGEAKK